MEVEHGNWEVGQNENGMAERYQLQMIHRMALACECCFLENNLYQPADTILIAKVVVDENNPAASITSRVSLCARHSDTLQTKNGWDWYQGNTAINMEMFQQNHFKNAKKIKPPNVTEEVLQQALQETSTYYCCRVLRQRYLNIIKQIQQLESEQFEASKRAVVAQKKVVLKQTKDKFELYLKNKEKMSIRQKFLMMKWYQRMEKKSKEQIKYTPIESNAEQSLLMASKTMYIES